MAIKIPSLETLIKSARARGELSSEMENEFVAVLMCSNMWKTLQRKEIDMRQLHLSPEIIHPFLRLLVAACIQ